MLYVSKNLYLDCFEKVREIFLIFFYVNSNNGRSNN